MQKTKTKDSNILVIGDMHFKDNLSYADYVPDRRIEEKKEILDFVIKQSKDCEHIVFLGDNFNSKNNSSETNREFVEFIEKFQDKEIYIISGNHEKKGDGKTAIDFLGEIKKDNWHIFTKFDVMEIGTGKDTIDVHFLPYLIVSELGVETIEDATKEIMKILVGGDILFAHHSISGTSFNGIKTDVLNEIVLPKEELEKRYKLIVAGHIHEPQQNDRTLITGGLFTNDVGEIERFIYKIHSDFSIKKLKVPARGIYKLENPSVNDLKKIPKNSIVKTILTDKKIDLEDIQSNLKQFDASLLIEDYPNSRKKAHIEEGAFDFSIETLLKLYAKERDVDYQKLLFGFQLINQ